MKQVKVSNVRMHKPSTNGDGKDVPVTEGVVAFAKSTDDSRGTLFCDYDGKIQLCIMHLEDSLRKGQKLFKPIVISEKEKLAVGDICYTPEFAERGLASLQLIVSESDIRRFSILGAKKVIVLNENLSLKHLDVIVSGKVKEGDKVFVECEAIPNEFDNPMTNPEGLLNFEGSEYVIKLNSRFFRAMQSEEKTEHFIATIYPTNEKKEGLRKFVERYHDIRVMESFKKADKFFNENVSKFLTILILPLMLLFGAGTLQAQNGQQRLDSLLKCLKTAPNDTTKANIMVSIYEIYGNTGNYPKAIEYILSAKSIYEKYGNENMVAYCISDLGYFYSYQKDYETALSCLRKAKRGIRDEVIYIAFGNVFLGMNNPDSALFYQQKALEIYTRKSNIAAISNVLNEIGTIYEDKNKIDSAITYYYKALEFAEKTKNSNSIADALASLGDAFYKKGDYKKSITYENKSLQLAKATNYLYSIRETEKMLSDIYLKLGDSKSSLVHYKNHIAVKDSMINEENIRQITRTEENSKFEKEKELAKAEQDKKDAVEAQQLQNQKNIRNAVIGGLALVLIFSAFVFNRWRVTRRQKAIIEKQKHLVEHQKKEMTDNINYASRIQKAILPPDDFMKNPMLFPENFIINRPKDIVSGDFYWAYSCGSENGTDFYIATADCTGHGVSGAMLTMIGSSLLNEIVIQRKITQPDLVLNTLRDEIVKALNHEGATEERKDGMDISFVKLIMETGRTGQSANDFYTTWKLECASANNNIYIVRNGEAPDKKITDIKADRMPVGKYIGDMKPFTLNKVDLQEGDIIYTLSDGFCDQFGGERGKKLMTKRFKEWIVELASYTMPQTKDSLEQRFAEWVGKGEQIDDVTIVALKV